MRLLSATVFVVCSLILIAAGDGGEKKGKDKADGAWIVVGMEQDGKKLPAEALDKLEMKLIIKGENYEVSMGGKVIEKGTSSADETKKPIALDIKPADGPNKGKTILAIAEIDGDSMKSCYNMEGKDRPKEFSTKEGSGHLLILFKRDAKKKE